MDTQQHQKTKEKVADKQHGEAKFKQEGKDPPPPPPTAASPPSPSSSPTHEFSFTISLHSSSTTIPDKTKTPPSFAIDLSPADDIFFHGHLLPLHLLSHLPVSPRTSTNSLDSFTLPIRDLLEDQKPSKNSSNSSSSNINSTNNSNSEYDRTHHHSNHGETEGRPKSKSFSLFNLTKWRKGSEIREREEKEKHRRKPRFDMSHVLKRYVRMVRPLLFFRGRRENVPLRRQPYSFSGNLSWKGKQELRGRRGEFSAPASMRTSPTNSGLLVATTTLPSSTNDSTMEELQAAIQAAIAHCKNSIAVEEKKPQMIIRLEM
ncbi:hypothetical protein L1049_025676 [Liquidambar formosana]|uniref:BRI1 kinase inhibitor 1-like n=1 Tax=Liquidambar formosana TaxID=63359 RepID=A0AAP0R4S2_LIQFO